MLDTLFCIPIWHIPLSDHWNMISIFSLLLPRKNCRLCLSKSGLVFKRNNWPWDKTAQCSCWLFSTEAVSQQDIEFSLEGHFFGMCLLSADNLIFYFCWKEKTPDSWKAFGWKQNKPKRFGNTLQCLASYVQVRPLPPHTTPQPYPLVHPNSQASRAVQGGEALDCNAGKGANPNSYKPQRDVFKQIFQVSTEICE